MEDWLKKEPYKYEAHSFKKTKRLPWLVCSKCGLITLHNPFTEWSIKLGCNYHDHVEYANKRIKFTKL